MYTICIFPLFFRKLFGKFLGGFWEGFGSFLAGLGEVWGRLLDAFGEVFGFVLEVKTNKKRQKLITTIEKHSEHLLVLYFLSLAVFLGRKLSQGRISRCRIRICDQKT